MAKIIFTAEQLRNPSKSRILNCRIEPALDCDGLMCGIWNCTVGDEQPPEIEPHFHLVVSGEEPKTSPRYLPFY